MGANRKLESEERFCKITFNMASSPAWRALRPASIKVYIELLSRYNGRNNGELHLSYGSAAKLLRLGKTTVSSAFDDLQEKGFIVKTENGNWDEQRAATWRLTHRKDNRPNGGYSTNEWRHWSNAHSNGKAINNHFSVPKRNQMGTISEPDGS